MKFKKTKPPIKITVAFHEIREIYDLLTLRQWERKEISAWATLRMQAARYGLLEYEPASAKDKIWKILCYLSVIDKTIDPEGDYQYPLNEILNFRSRLKF